MYQGNFPNEKTLFDDMRRFGGGHGRGGDRRSTFSTNIRQSSHSVSNVVHVIAPVYHFSLTLSLTSSVFLFFLLSFFLLPRPWPRPPPPPIRTPRCKTPSTSETLLLRLPQVPSRRSSSAFLWPIHRVFGDSTTATLTKLTNINWCWCPSHSLVTFLFGI